MYRFWIIALLVTMYILAHSSVLNFHQKPVSMIEKKLADEPVVQTPDSQQYIAPDSFINLTKLFQLSTNDLRHLFNDSIIKNGNYKQRIEYYSELGLETPYVLSSLGEGPLGLYDKDPLLDLTRVDCMTFCEQILALSISPNYDEFFRILQKIRYTGDVVNIIKRNHFVIADWLPDNQWLLEDLTQKIGGNSCKRMTKTIHRRLFIRTLGVKDSLNDVPGPDTLSQPYIPKEVMPEIKSQLKNGDIVCLATHRKGIFVSHMGFFIIKPDQEIYFRNASSSSQKVIDEPYSELYNRLLKKKSAAGIIIFRVRTNFALK
ncbi:DUF1460 domain-containing protein [candidate division KSB1 bacterium]|nr:DUF1460 domain-containing protein [candidate division KSB1 bacterium]